MSEQVENPPAFPQGHLEGPAVNPEGMSLRDFFAAKAMAAILSRDDTKCEAPELGPMLYAMISKGAFMIADAMLAARLKGQNE